MILLKRIKKKIKALLKRFNTLVIKTFTPIHWKELNELNYWKSRKQQEGILSNNHYEYFYTTHFGLSPSFYKGKTILDLGCGPRGSLEWATMAERRIGLDPLASEYLKLGTEDHKMEYISSASESIPLKSGQCDAVFSFNSLDHVANVEETICEIKRVVKKKGILLLLIEINHPPTNCEPHELSPKQLINFLKPEFQCESIEVYKPTQNGIYESIMDKQLFLDPLETVEIGYLSAKFIRIKPH